MVSVLARLVRMSLPSRGAWIEIPIDGFQNTVYRSLPSRGAWIEILVLVPIEAGCAASLPSRGAWIEIPLADSFRRKWSHRSLPSRGAWIEILHRWRGSSGPPVAPLTGSVD